MKKILAVSVVVVFVALLFMEPAGATISEKYYDSVFNEIKAEMQVKGIFNDEMEPMRTPVKAMLKRGISKNSVKSTLGELWFFLLRGSDLREVVTAMADMEKKGSIPGGSS